MRSRSFLFDPFRGYEKGERVTRENKFVRPETKIFPDTIFIF